MLAILVKPKATSSVASAPSNVPDTRSFLATAIVIIVGGITFILLFHPIDLSDKVFGVLATLLGVLTGCFKDVYNFSFGTTKNSADKDETIAQQSVSLAASAPVAPSTTTTTVKTP